MPPCISSRHAKPPSHHKCDECGTFASTQLTQAADFIICQGTCIFIQ
ncbi:hypothetical protein C3B79_2115 [Aeromonas hydrophila]|nr:hypothetical protein C3B79_2115 [Aeromonas hydrophila]